jgi:hypothetical protein
VTATAAPVTGEQYKVANEQQKPRLVKLTPVRSG